MSDKWGQYHADDVRMLVEQYPLAWVCSTRGFPETARLPLIGEYGADGTLVGLIGHMARANPLRTALVEHAEVLILFSGPDGYVSPQHAGKRDWAPTWNYAQLRIRGDVVIDAALTDMSLDMLTTAVEQGRPAPWSREEIAYRYPAMAGAIIGFRVMITALEGRFKLGQDEDDATFARILDRHPDQALTAWMRRFNPDRGAPREPTPPEGDLGEKTTGPLR